MSAKGVRERRIEWRSTVTAVLAAGVLVAACGGASADPTNGSPLAEQPAASEMPADSVGSGSVSTTPMNAPTVIDVPSTVVASQMVSEPGATIVVDEMSLSIPAGALVAETTVDIVRLDAPFQMNPFADDPPNATPVVMAGPAYDFGPPGVRFDQPVEITLPLAAAPVDSEAIGTAFDQPVLAYWTGDGWALLVGDVDTDASTITIRLESFDGTLLTPAYATAEALGDLLGGASQAGVKVARLLYGTDPMIEREADAYITPDDPVVQAAAAGANVDGVPLDDEKQLAAILATGRAVRISIPGADGTPQQFTYSARSGSNWQKPADHLSASPSGDNFDGVPAIGNMQGDCTDVANSTTSIFRALGYPAKGVFGYAGNTDSPHAWTEVVIGGKPYIVDEVGNIQELEKAFGILGLIRADPTWDSRAVEWDENGVRPYEEQWWTKYAVPEVDGVWTGTMTWSGYTDTGPGAGCSTTEGLPLTADLAMSITARGDGSYDVDFEHGTPSVSVTIRSSSDSSTCQTKPWTLSDRPAAYGMVMQLSGRSLTGQTGTDFTLAVAGAVGADGSMTGDITVTYATGALTGTWVATKT